MKVFITEFRMGDTVYEGPCICAETFEEAEKEAEAYNVLVVGVLEGFINFTEDNVWNRVLH
jgi:hypothetical protein